MKKYFIFAAFAGLALTSCTDDDLVGNASPPVDEDVLAPISFSSSQNAFTRADFVGAEAAEKLNNMFVVTGFKGTTTATPTSGTIVFDNYKVVYEENTANKSESNTNNWEYAGKDRIQHAIDNGITQQTVKYWDYTQTQYDFIAWGMGKVDVAGTLTPITPVYGGTGALSDHQVRVSAIKPNGKGGWGSGSGMSQVSYTFEGTAEDLAHCYISDLVTVYKNAKTVSDDTYNVVYKGYQKPVTLKFRQLGTKVRIGLYETVPGYSVKNVKFYSAAASDDASSAAAKIFTTVANGIYKEGTYTIYFPTVDSPTNADNNQAHIEFTPKTGAAQKTTVDWGGLNYTFRESGETSTEAKYLGRASNDASYAGNAADNYYVIYLPNQNGTNLNLRVDYTLESIDGSKETILVRGATAQVPSIYTAWKPGYAYTYLFKISDKTNGHTGVYDPTKPDDTTVNSDPAGLYPITFDAVVVNAEEDATQETITTISTPSITTYQKGSKVVNQSEYDHATGPIFVTVNDGGGYVAVSPTPISGTDVSSYYKLDAGKYVKCGNTETSDGTTTYYELKPVLANSELVTLTASGNGQAALYTLPTGKAYTEADVVDAMQVQDDDAAANTVKGRSGLVLTKAAFTLENKVEYGVDGNTIDLTTLPKQDGTDGTYSANAMKFTAAAAGTYAFVYTKTAKTGTDTKLYEAKSFTSGASVNGYYRYTLKAATAPVADSHTGDVEKGVTYFKKSDASTPAITAFLGQTVDNLFTRSGSGSDVDPYVYTPARGYAQTGTTYYYTTNGQTYTAATQVAYADFKTTTLYTDPETQTDATKKDSSLETPADGQAYYDGDGKYCVIYPQRTDGLYVFTGTDTSVAANITACGATTAVDGMVYFDMYTQNNGVYYAKIIKVQ